MHDVSGAATLNLFTSLRCAHILDDMCGLCELALSQFVTHDRVHKIPILCVEASAESSEMIGIKMLLVICGKLSI